MNRGFISLELIAVIGLVAALVGGAWWLRNDGARQCKAENEASVAKARAERQEMVSGLALDLATAREDLRKERSAREARELDIRREREAALNAYVPKVPGSDVCIRTGFVLYANAAAAGVPLGARPEPGVAQAPAGIGTDEVARIIGRNYDKYQDCKRTVAGILAEFDTNRTKTNTVIDRINNRLQRAERKVQ